MARYALSAFDFRSFSGRGSRDARVLLTLPLEMPWMFSVLIPFYPVICGNTRCKERPRMFRDLITKLRSCISLEKVTEAGMSSRP